MAHSPAPEHDAQANQAVDLKARDVMLVGKVYARLEDPAGNIQISWVLSSHTI
jgi:hypothetical protein